MHGIRHTGYAGNELIDGAGSKILSLYCHTTITKGQPYVVDYDATNGMKTAAPVTALYPVTIVVALEDCASGKIGLFQEYGENIETLVATGVAVSDHLELIAAGTSLIVDGSTGSTVRTKGSKAIALEANASGVAALRKVRLFRELVEVAAT
jgi:hypothetical protein